MKTLTCILVFSLVLAPSAFVYSADDDDDSSQNTAGNALTGALMGGLLGGGLGAAIGSASGNAGKGALIGAGIGAVGGTLMKASQDSQRAKEASYDRPAGRTEVVTGTTPIPKNARIKKKIIRTYDEKGNVASEEEVNN